MKTCEYAGPVFSEVRSHPWTDAADNPECRYYDLTASPELIPSVLEDLIPWAHTGAIEQFYLLLAALNHPSSELESNDCAFSGPLENDSPAFSQSLQCSGRVMILFRSLAQNTVDGEIETLAYQLHVGLAKLDPEFRLGVIGTTVVPVRFLALEAGGSRQLGSQLMISFWAWGDTEEETMSNLERLLKNLSEVLLDVRAVGRAASSEP